MLNNLTGLRFYAAMWVFLYHFSVYVGGLENILFQKGYLGVDVFFVLSGFILTFAYYKSFFLEAMTIKKYYHFLVKRWAKIYPLHLLTFLMISVLLYVGKYLFHQNDLVIRKDHIVSNLFMSHAWDINDALSWNTHSWSLSDEWFAYLFLFVGSVFLVRTNKIWGRVVLAGITFFFVLKWLIVEDFNLNNYTYKGLERIIPEFFLGISIGLLRFDFQISKKTASFIFVCCVVTFLTLAFTNYKVDALCMIVFGGVIYSLSFPTYFDVFFNSKTLVYLGNISFAFYMFQLIAFYLFKPFQNYIVQAGLSYYVSTPVALLFLFLLNFLMASLTFKYFEEPMRILLVKKMIKP